MKVIYPGAWKPPETKGVYALLLRSIALSSYRCSSNVKESSLPIPVSQPRLLPLRQNDSGQAQAVVVMMADAIAHPRGADPEIQGVSEWFTAKETG